MLNETLIYRADGLTMRSELFFNPGSHPRPAVLVFPEAFGLGEHAIERAKRLAAAGYVALACDLHGEAQFVDDLSEAMNLLKPLFDNPSRTRTRAFAALHALVARPEVDSTRVAAIGFCFPIPLELARAGADLCAVVGFHTGLATNAPISSAGTITTKVLVCIGADDPYIRPDQRAAFEAEMQLAGADWQMHVYGGTVHSFTNKEVAKRAMPDALRYSLDADTRSWASMLELFAETLAKKTSTLTTPNA